MPDLFPLPLIPFEEYMLFDDWPSHPMEAFIRLRFNTPLNRAWLEQAVALTLRRHPLLTATIEQKGRRRFQWKEASHLPVKIVFMKEEPAASLPRFERLHIREETGFRLIVVEGENASDLILQFHHCCCDGLGCLQFASDMLIVYDCLSNNSDPLQKLRDCDPDRLRQRDRYGLSRWDWLRLAPRQMIGLSGVRQFIMNKPKPLVEKSLGNDQEPLPADYPAIRVHHLSKQETTLYRKAAKKHGVTRNDLLSRDLFVALGEWRAKHALGPAEDCLRFSIPMNLRRAEDRAMPATNVVSSIFFDRHSKEFADPQELLQGIHDQMELIKRNQLGLTFLLSLRFLSLIPGGLRRTASTSRCQASALLTNLGLTFPRLPLKKREGRLIVGGAILEQANLIAPFRPYQNIAVALSVYAGCQEICIHYDSRVITSKLADDLCAIYKNNLLNTIHAETA